MEKVSSIVDKMANQAIKNVGTDDYRAAINAATDREAFALMVYRLDEIVGHEGDFKEWANHGYGASKRAARVSKYLKTA